MTHNSLSPAPYKLIPFDPVPCFLAIAGLAIVVNLLVLVGVLLKSLKPNLVGKVKKLVWSEDKNRGNRPFDPPQTFAGETYEMDVEVGSPTATARPPRQYTAEGHVGSGAQSWGPAGQRCEDRPTER